MSVIVCFRLLFLFLLDFVIDFSRTYLYELFCTVVEKTVFFCVLVEA